MMHGQCYSSNSEFKIVRFGEFRHRRYIKVRVVITDHPHDVEAIVTMLGTEQGGRRTAVASGYRGQFFYNSLDWDAIHVFPDIEQVYPGSTSLALLWFASPGVHWGKVYAGMPFLIREGSRIVGYGAISRIVDLERSAAKDILRA